MNEQQTQESFEGWAAMAEALAPIRVMATGQKAALEVDGWSPTAAEQMAAVVYSNAVSFWFASFLHQTTKQ